MKKKQKQNLFEKYPLWMVLVFNLIVFSVYATGIYLTYLVYTWAALIFLIYILIIEYTVYSGGCRYCYYYGKRCFSGRGKLAPIIIKKGNPKKFCEKEISFKDFIPHLLVVFIPVIFGIYILIKDFNWWILLITLWPLLVNFIGNPIIYGKMACPHCKQGAKCCPALNYFKKNYEPRGKKREK